METNTNHPNDTVKLVALINKRLESGVAMNALAHATAAAVNLAGQEGRESLKFLDFADADGQVYPGISARSFIILRGTDADIRKLRASAMAAGLPAVAFTNTMTGGTYIEQLERTKVAHAQDLVFYALVVLGNAETLNPLTKKLSLWRSDPPPPQAIPPTGIPAGQQAQIQTG
jgi:hypothetical protein